jgi:hypothetical protein
MSKPHVELESAPSSRAPGSATQAAWGQTQSPSKRSVPWIALGGVLLAGGAAAAAILLANAPAPAPAGSSSAVLANAPAPTPSSGTAVGTARVVPSPLEPVVEPLTSASANPKDVRTTLPATSAAKPRDAAPVVRRSPVRAAQPAAAQPAAAPLPPKKPPPDLYSDRK